jgi:hypothetical protein
MVAAALFIVLGSAGYVAAFKFKSASSDIRAPIITAATQPVLQKWTNLPIEQAVPIASPADLENAVIDVDRDRQQLRMDTSGLVLLPLGSVSGSTYKIQIGFRQNNWKGSFGLYFGFRTELLPNGESAHKYQEVRLLQKPTEREREGPRYFLHRRSATLRVDDRGTLSERSRDLAWSEVNLVDLGEQILEVTVAPGELQKVRWAGQDQPDLTCAAVNALFQQMDYDGDFGVTNYKAATTVSNARIMFLRRLR